MIDPMTSMTLLYIALAVGGVLAFAVPFYMGVWAALYWVYEARGKANPMPALKYETSQVWDQFVIHLHHWQANASKLSFIDFTVPLFLPVLIGSLVGIAAAYGVVRYAINIFRVTD